MKEFLVTYLPIAVIVIAFILFFIYSRKKALKLLYDGVECAEQNILGTKQGQIRKQRVIDNFYASSIVPWYLKALPRSVIEGWLEKAVSLLKTSIKYAYEHTDDHKQEDKEEVSAQDEEEG